MAERLQKIRNPEDHEDESVSYARHRLELSEARNAKTRKAAGNVISILLSLALVVASVAYFAWQDDLMPDKVTKKVQVSNNDGWTGLGAIVAGAANGLQWLFGGGKGTMGQETFRTEKVEQVSPMGYVDDAAFAAVAIVVLYITFFKRKSLG